MSYDILAFDPEAVTDDDFVTWWEAQANWTEPHAYDDPSVTTPALRAFYRELAVEFPPLNVTVAPGSASQELLLRRCEYDFGYELVYGGGSWSLVSELQEAWERVGRKHGVAIAFVSNSPLRIVRP